MAHAYVTKRHIGFKWACPRFGPDGFDVGKAIWDIWLRRSTKVNTAVQFLLGEGTADSGAYQLHHFTKAMRDVLGNILQIENAEVFTSYSLRRSMPTLANLRQAPEEEADALGDWLGTKNSRMRTRYSDERERTALMAKLMQAELVTEMANMTEQVSWQAVPALLARIPLAKVQARVNERVASEEAVASAPAEWVGHLVQVRKRFGLGKMSAPPRKPPAATERKPVLGAVPFVWEATKKRGAILVHLLPQQGAVPFCRRKKGARGQQLKRVVAKGETMQQLCAVAELDSLCSDCVRLSGLSLPSGQSL